MKSLVNIAFLLLIAATELPAGQTVWLTNAETGVSMSKIHQLIYARTTNSSGQPTNYLLAAQREFWDTNGVQISSSAFGRIDPKDLTNFVTTSFPTNLHAQFDDAVFANNYAYVAAIEIHDLAIIQFDVNAMTNTDVARLTNVFPTGGIYPTITTDFTNLYVGVGGIFIQDGVAFGSLLFKFSLSDFSLVASNNLGTIVGHPERQQIHSIRWNGTNVVATTYDNGYGPSALFVIDSVTLTNQEFQIGYGATDDFAIDASYNYWLGFEDVSGPNTNDMVLARISSDRSTVNWIATGLGFWSPCYGVFFDGPPGNSPASPPSSNNKKYIWALVVGTNMVARITSDALKTELLSLDTNFANPGLVGFWSSPNEIVTDGGTNYFVTGFSHPARIQRFSPPELPVKLTSWSDTNGNVIAQMYPGCQYAPIRLN